MKKMNVFSVVVMALVIGAASCAAYSMEGGMGKKGDMGGKQKMEGMGHKGMMGMMGDMGMMDMMDMMDGMHMDMMLKDPMMQKELGLTADQKSRLKKIFLDEKRTVIRSEADVKVLHLDLMELLEAPMPDSAKIDAKIDEIAAACGAMMKIKIHAMRDAKSVLTPEQHEKCMAMMKKMGMGGKDMKGMKGMGDMKTRKAVKGGKAKGKSVK